jgi:4'-phosphopantetheinyl transferase
MSDLSAWPLKVGSLELEDTQVHVWRAGLGFDETVLRRLESTLAAEEKNRAKRLVFRSDQDRFVGTRGILRDLLGKYINCSPAKVEFHYDPKGKPVLKDKVVEKSIQFSVSHSASVALLAFAVGRHLGVDVELIRPKIAALEIAERYFSPQEVAELRALPTSHHAQAFFLGWTRKEAYVKAKGEGLHIPLESFSVSLTPDQPERLECADSHRWGLRSLCPAPGYVGAVVCEGQDWRTIHWTWQESLS